MISGESTHAGLSASRLFPQTNDPAFPDGGDAGNPTTFEEQVRMAIIRGNVIAGGFTNDVQTIRCRTLHAVADFNRWLNAPIPPIATASEVRTFNRLFQAIRARRGERVGSKATWTNSACSFDALQHLLPID